MMPFDPALDAALDDVLRLARQGDGGRTREAIEGLRQRFDVHRQPQATVRLMLAEGIMLAYEGEHDAARDRMRRALAVGGLACDAAPQALAHAWAAYLDYGDARMESVVRHATRAVELGQRQCRGAVARAASLLAMVAVSCGESALAARWFALARRLAAAEDDGAMTSVSIFNMAAARFAAARVRLIAAGQRDALDPGESLFLQSSRAYDAGRRVEVQGYLHRMLQGLALSAGGQHGAALDALAIFDTDQVPELWRADATVSAEQGWCRWQLGDRAGAEHAARKAAAGVDALTDTGEQAIVHARLRDLFDALGDAAARDAHEHARAAVLARHEAGQAQLRELVRASPLEPDQLSW